MSIIHGHSFGTGKKAEYRKLHLVSKNFNVTSSPDVVIRKWSKEERMVGLRMNSGYIGGSQRNEKTNEIHFLTMLLTSWAGTFAIMFFPPLNYTLALNYIFNHFLFIFFLLKCLYKEIFYHPHFPSMESNFVKLLLVITK